jgi:membrane protease YdiL (CAAX protease family)
MGPIGGNKHEQVDNATRGASMMTARASITRHPVLAFYALTFAISWGGILLVIGGPGGIPATKEQVEALVPLVILVLLAGPAVAGILLSGLVYGKTGLREVLSRLLKWRVGARWYAVALLPAPLLMTAVGLALWLLSVEFLPGILTTSDKGALLLSGIAAGVTTVLEELGWTGFAVPRLRLRHGVLATGLIVGVLWGVWHFLVKAWMGGAMGLGPFLTVDLLTAVVNLTAYRVLLVWVYDRTGSLLVTTLMHASLTASMLIITPQVTGMPLVTYNLVSAAALWGLVAAVAVVNRGQLSR